MRHLRGGLAPAEDLHEDRPELVAEDAVDEDVDGGVEDEEEVGEEGEDLAPHWPVVQSLRPVDQEQTDLQRVKNLSVS